MISFELSFSQSTKFSAKLGCVLEMGHREAALLNADVVFTFENQS